MKIGTTIGNNRLHRITRIIFAAYVIIVFLSTRMFGQSSQDVQSPLLVRKCNDFTITGKGGDPEWSKAEKVTPTIVEYIKQHPKWELSLQIHKYINVP